LKGWWAKNLAGLYNPGGEAELFTTWEKVMVIEGKRHRVYWDYILSAESKKKKGIVPSAPLTGVLALPNNYCRLGKEGDEGS